MSTYTQTERPLALDTPLGKDVLLLTEFYGQEDMSRLFRYNLELLSEKESLGAKDLVGKNVTFWVEFTSGEPRHFNGFVNRFSHCGKNERLNIYRAEVVPWLWFLTRTADCRIFQNKTAPDIIKQIFADLGFSDFKFQLSGSHPSREYCVQYRETDFNFVSRLMEEEGIYYYFQHEKGKHTLVVSDAKGSYYDCKDKDAQFQAPNSASEVKDHISRWEHQYEFRSGKYAQTDYNFETPSNSLMTNTSSVIPLDGMSKFEIYDYPGLYTKKADGDSGTKAYMEQVEAGYDTVEGESHCRSFSPGGKFKMKRHPVQSEEGKGYVVTSVRHSARMTDAYSSGPDEGGHEYRNQFAAIPDSVTFRPERTTPKPRIHGSQTAIVVGPGGEEIWPDKYARVKVQFHWDREGKKDDKSSCWIRVSTPWSGKNWGMIQIPRIGQEVVVSHLEGDPDRPLITGMVYNAETMPPYELPANKTQSGIKTRSSKGGSPANFNEIRFEDKKGSELLSFHAEKDQKIVVENDRDEYVGHDRSLTVDHDKSELVKNNKTIAVLANHTEDITANMAINVGSNLTETVAINYAETVGAAMELTVGGVLAISVGAAMSEMIGGTKTETIGGSKTTTVGAGVVETIGKDLSETIGKNRTTKIGKDYEESVEGKHMETVTKEYSLNAQKILLVAKDEITIKTGDAMLVMKKNGDINIKGNKISIKGSGDVVLKGSKITEN